MRRTNADKRKAVTEMLEDEEWCKWSNLSIAKQCRVSDEFVRQMRMKLDTSNVGSMNSAERTFIHPKTGKPTMMNTENIGKKNESDEIPKSKRLSMDATARSEI